MLVWVGDVGCWRGIPRFWRGDPHLCEVLHCNQCSFLQEVAWVLFLWAAVGVGVGVGCWCGVLVWAVGVGCWRGILKFWRGDSYPCETLRFNQCSYLE